MAVNALPWKRIEDAMPPEGRQVWAWYTWDSKPVKAHWERGEDNGVVWMHPQHYVINVKHWMGLEEMWPE